VPADGIPLILHLLPRGEKGIPAVLPLFLEGRGIEGEGGSACLAAGKGPSTLLRTSFPALQQEASSCSTTALLYAEEPKMA
jgi:hypothetical protein